MSLTLVTLLLTFQLVSSDSSGFSIEVGTTGLGNSMSKLIRQIKPMRFPAETQDPFLFAAYHLDKYPNGKSGDDVSINAPLHGRNIGSDFGNKDWNMYHGDSVPGFPSHPHRGFETITLARQGFTDHFDSLGNYGRFGNGDTQWMTAGKGVSHSEMFPQVEEDKPNTLDLFQIWLNLPPKSKLCEPHYKMMWAETAVFVNHEDDNGKKTLIQTVAGKLPDGEEPSSPPPDSWASDPNHHVAVWIIQMEPGATWTMPKTDSKVNRSLFYFKGASLSVGGEKLSSHANMQLDPAHDIPLHNTGDEAAELLMLQGVPIGAPVAQHGPFVMNTREELMDSFREYQEGKFGQWPWKKDDPTMERKHPRYAKYPNGTEEYPAEKFKT